MPGRRGRRARPGLPLPDHADARRRLTQLRSRGRSPDTCHEPGGRHAAGSGRARPDGRQHGASGCARAGHEVVGFDRNPDVSRRRRPRRAGRASWPPPRVVWVMVPAEVTEADHRRAGRPAQRGRPRSSTVATRTFTDDGPRAERLGRARHRLRRRRRLRRRLGPRERVRPDGRRRRRARRRGSCRSSTRSSRRASSASCTPAPVGAGHYAKMVHNGIEYGLMHAYAEGYELLQRLRVRDRRARASSSRGGRARSSGPGCSTCSTARSTRIRSWPRCAGYADDTGEGRWTVDEAIRLAVPLHVISAVAVRPVRLPAGRLAGDEGGRRAAQPVRRPRGPS